MAVILNGFILEPCIACFSMEIALRNEIQTYTGDNRIEAEVLPEHKSAIGRQLQTVGLIVTMKSAGITLIKGDRRGIVRL